MNSMSTLAPTSRTLQMQLHGGMGTARLIRICRELSYYPRYFYTTSTSEVHPNSEPRQQRLSMFDLDFATDSRKRYSKIIDAHMDNVPPRVFIPHSSMSDDGLQLHSIFIISDTDNGDPHDTR